MNIDALKEHFKQWHRPIFVDAEQQPKWDEVDDREYLDTHREDHNPDNISGLKAEDTGQYILHDHSPLGVRRR